MPVLTFLQRWFAERREVVQAERQRHLDARQQRRNEALWAVMNVAPGTRQVDRNVPRAIKAGADLNAIVPEGYGRASGQRPLGWAVNAERWDLVVWLLKQGANPNHADSPSLLEWRSHAPPGQHVRQRSYIGPVPVFAAALLKIAYVQDDDSVGLDAKQALWPVIDAFLDHGADPSLRADGTTGIAQVVMRTPHLYQWSRTPGAIPRLRQMGLNVADEHGRTPLHWAVRYGYHEAREDIPGVRTLLRAGANPYAADLLGNSPLHDLAEVVRCGDQDPGVLTTIIQEFADLDWDRPNHQGQSPWAILQNPDSMALQDRQAYIESLNHLRAYRIARERQVLMEAVDTDPNGGTNPLTTDVSVPRRGRQRL